MRQTKVTKMIDIRSTLKENAAITEVLLDYYMSPEKIGTGKLQDAMRYSLLGGGKRVRACLALEFAKLFSGSDITARPYAAAIEMIHAFSLIHDDLPCMDDDDMRRGKPSCHIAFGEATALLAGDALFTYAFEVASGAEGVSDIAARCAVSALSYNTGTLGMGGGQQMDLENSVSSYNDLKKLHSMKTSALIKAACLCGYYSTLSEEPDNLVVATISDYAECVGLAFQIKDDLLDLKGDAALLGKRVGVDEKNGRINSLTFLTPEEAERECDELSSKARELISVYGTSEFLMEFPTYLNSRNN